MSQTISGIYLMLEGSDSGIDSVAYNREPTWCTDNPSNHYLRYKDNIGGVHKLYEYPVTGEPGQAVFVTDSGVMGSNTMVTGLTGVSINFKDQFPVLTLSGMQPAITTNESNSHLHIFSNGINTSTASLLRMSSGIIDMSTALNTSHSIMTLTYNGFSLYNNEDVNSYNGFISFNKNDALLIDSHNTDVSINSTNKYVKLYAGSGELLPNRGIIDITHPKQITTKEYVDELVSAGIELNGLVLGTENTKTGYWLKNDDRLLKGDIGEDAVDLSTSDNDLLVYGATGIKCFAEGYNTFASGIASHAEGISTIATWQGSHSEGLFTIASSNGSHAEGTQTAANGYYSHAEGAFSLANGDASHADGWNTKAIGHYSHTEGYYTATGYKFDVISSSVGVLVVSGDQTSKLVTSNNIPVFLTNEKWLSAISTGYIISIEYSAPNTIITYTDNIATSHLTNNVSYITANFNGDSTGYASHAEGHYTIAIGSTSHAEGNYTIAGGVVSHAEGSITTANGHYSHAEGYGTTASGNDSHAEGFGVTASGSDAHAEGNGTLASGDHSHTEGWLSTASGTNSHAEGDGVLASGIDSHAEGKQTIASGLVSHAEGESSTASGDVSHAEGLSTLASGDYSHAEGSGSQATGSVSHAEGSSIASGNTSHAEGGNTTASGTNSHSEGAGTTAAGLFSHAEGYLSISKGIASHSEGDNTKTLDVFYSQDDIAGSVTILDDVTFYFVNSSNLTVYRSDTNAEYTIPSSDIISVTYENLITTILYNDGNHVGLAGNIEYLKPNNYQYTGHASHTEGLNTTAFGRASHTEGWNTRAVGEYSHAEGNTTVANGSSSHSEGLNSLASGNNSHAEGDGTLASGLNSHVEGYGSTATGESSHSEGYYTFATGTYSHAEGSNTTASGQSSHAEGSNTTASGPESHAGGNGTKSKGSASFTTGYYTTSVGYSDASIGQMNVSSNQLLFVDRSEVVSGPEIILYIKGDYSSYFDYNTNQLVDIVFTSDDINTTFPYVGTFSNPLNQTVTYDNIEDETLVYTLSGPPGYTIIGVVPHSIIFNPMLESVPSAATSIGMENIAGAPYVMAIGHRTKAFGKASFSSGFGSTASGDNSHAEGYMTTSSGDASHSEGFETISSAPYTHAEGYNTIASGLDAHAEGQFTIASGDHSHAEGLTTIASGESSHAEGSNNTASGSYSHVEGGFNYATGNYSHAEGSVTVASGPYSHAEGTGTIVASESSHVEGDHNEITSSAPSGAHAEGRYCVNVTTNQIHVTGIGTSISDRKNGFVVETTGKVIAPELTTTILSAELSTSKCLVTKEYMTEQISSAIASGMNYKGGYNADTDTPSLDDGTPIAGIKIGDVYTVTVGGTFFTEVVEPGDTIIAKQDDPTELSHWVVVQVNMTPNSILTAIKEVDGEGSGLDADLLDNQHGSYYLNVNHIIDEDNMVSNSDIKVPTQQSVKAYVDGKLPEVVTLTTSATTPNQVADTNSSTTYRTIKYVVSITSSTSYQACELLVCHDGSTAKVTEYGNIYTGSALSTFDVDVSGGNVRLLVTPTNAVTTYKIIKTVIPV